MSAAEVHDARICALGEGPLWHPLRKQLFWFDILGRKMLCDSGEEWLFEDHVSAAGWVSESELIIASARALLRFDLETGSAETVCDLEADNALTRSNDGRADPYGGFWIGTMGLNGEADAGAIYRYYKGELRQLFAPITISNAICFSPDGAHGFFTDTRKAQIMRVGLDSEGWPKSAPEIWLDLSKEGLNPDGAVIASDGTFLNAQWAASRIARYDVDGNFLEAFALPTPHITCPAFGGDDLSTLFATSATHGLDAPDNDAGKTFVLSTNLTGQREHQVIL